ncbi:MAG: hypothetical protein WBW48_06855, partial [Anaerolineae bacterium]
RHSRTGHDSFPSSGSSVHEPLSSVTPSLPVHSRLLGAVAVFGWQLIPFSVLCTPVLSKAKD